MKTLKIIILLFVVSTSIVCAQSDLVFKIENIYTSSDSIFLQFSFLNNGKETVKLYKPNKKDICYGIVKILLKDNTDKEYLIMPCDEIIDLDAIILNCKNSFYLSHNEKLIKEVRFSLKDAIPFLTKGMAYEVIMEVNLNDVSFEGETEDLCRCNFKTNYDFSLK